MNRKQGFYNFLTVLSLLIVSAIGIHDFFLDKPGNKLKVISDDISGLSTQVADLEKELDTARATEANTTFDMVSAIQFLIKKQGVDPSEVEKYMNDRRKKATEKPSEPMPDQPMTPADLEAFKEWQRQQKANQ